MLHNCMSLRFFFLGLQTTLARIIARSAQRSKLVQLSATTSGVADVKEAVRAAQNSKKLLKRKTLLFVDEIHRFNKLQQVTDSGTFAHFLLHAFLL